VILNITPDHLDRYAGMQEYIDVKAEIFKNQGDGDYLILNADDPETMKLYNAKCKMQNAKLRNVNILFFSRKKEVEGIYCKDDRLIFKQLPAPRTAPPAFLRKQEGGAVSSPLELIAVDEIKIKGVHNLENAMAASLAAFISGCTGEAIRSVLRDFSGLEHRLEFVCEIKGVSFINDSKGTNIGAVAKSLESLRKVVLIMGGRDKNGDFASLRNLIKKKVKALILLGEAREKIEKAVGKATDTVLVSGIKEAVELSMSKAYAGDVVLLSPGCASFDMFTGFEDRGEKFKEAVNKIKKSEFKNQNLN
jgi:UDP-N-acetylmuramoylalanine--D-glutamate ligase